MASTIILIGGISCSGKTTLARRLATELDAPYLSIDDYYRPFDNLPLDVRKRVDFDAPDAIEHELLTEQLSQLTRGETILKPVYDAAAFERLPTPEPIYANPFVVVEGLFALLWRDLIGLTSHRVFVETDPEICLARRLQRDVEVYGRSMEFALSRYREQVEPSQSRFVLPTKSNATLVVSGTCGDRGLRSCLDWIQSPTAPAASAMSL
ncbi:MAG TPA: hypothetical protein PKA27_04985 [Fimbriimonadaceae bacterium]|nr:hypothetical protein [Fimbriimonadaceae bacterium]